MNEPERQQIYKLKFIIPGIIISLQRFKILGSFILKKNKNEILHQANFSQKLNDLNNSSKGYSKCVTFLSNNRQIKQLLLFLLTNCTANILNKVLTRNITHQQKVQLPYLKALECSFISRNNPILTPSFDDHVAQSHPLVHLEQKLSCINSNKIHCSKKYN